MRRHPLKLFVLAVAAFLLPAGAQAQLPAGSVEHIAGGSFADGKGPFWESGNVTITQPQGALCARIGKEAGEPWQAQIGVGDIKIAAGQNYRVSARITGTDGAALRIRIQRDSEPYTAHYIHSIRLPLAADTFQATFTAMDGAPASLIFQLGGAAETFDLCLDNISLRETATDGQEEAPPSAIRVNQAGYLRTGPKRATLVAASSKPLAFGLVDAEGKRVFDGMTKIVLFDPGTGLKTHVIDFSSFSAAGDAFHLVADDDESLSFSIGRGPYEALSVDALSWFYLARSGLAIDGTIAGEIYARPAGHG
ncbi:MAG: cellulase N-terminal Ig-like domain-containing protein, partial [Alphaproteobacteria bacterium]